MIYISGPLTNADPAQQQRNIDAALHVYKQLVLARCLAICPHLSAYVPGAFEMAYDTWLLFDLEIIARSGIATSLLILPNWENSSGAREEVSLAVRCKLPLFTRIQPAIDHYYSIHGAVPFNRANIIPR